MRRDNMGLLEKLKNTFFEEEYVEVEEKPKIKKEPKREKKVEEKREVLEKPRIVRHDDEESTVEVFSGNSAKRVEKIEEKKNVEVSKPRASEVQEEAMLKRETSFGYFDDDDFLDFQEEVYEPPKKPVQKVEPLTAKEVVKEKPKLYDNPSYAASSTASPKPYSKEAKAGFKPTPIISPIYGILDKNYTKDEIPEKKEVKPSSYVSRKNADLDSVREKAFGSLAGDFGLTSPGDSIQESKPVSDVDLEIEDNLLYDMTDTCKTPSVDKVTLQDAEEYFQDLGLEYNIDYKDAKLEKATGRRVSKTPKIDDIEEEVVKKEPVSTTEKDLEENGSLEDNLFDLIDSMYEEKE